MQSRAIVFSSVLVDSSTIEKFGSLETPPYTVGGGSPCAIEDVLLEMSAVHVSH